MLWNEVEVAAAQSRDALNATEVHFRVVNFTLCEFHQGPTECFDPPQAPITRRAVVARLTPVIPAL